MVKLKPFQSVTKFAPALHFLNEILPSCKSIWWSFYCRFMQFTSNATKSCSEITRICSTTPKTSSKFLAWVALLTCSILSGIIMEVIPLSIPLESFLSALTLTILHPTTGTGFLHRCFISADCKRTTVLQNWGHVYAWISRLRVIFMSPCSLFFYFQNDGCNISCWKCYFNLSTFRIRKQLFFSSHTLEVTVKCRSLCYKVHGALLIICNYSMYFGPFPLFFFFFIYLSYIWRQETPQTITVGDNKTVLCRFSCLFTILELQNQCLTALQ